MNITLLLSEIKTQGYANVSSTIPENIFQDAIHAFREFIQHTPIEERSSTDFRYDPTQRFNLGFRDKSTSEGFDEKCYFHFNPHIRDKGFLGENEYYQRFLGAMDTAHASIDSIVHEIADELIRLGYAPSISFYNDTGETNNNLRILQYRPKDTCEYLAKPHTDRGIFTLAVYETDPGLRFYTPDGAITPITYAPYTLRMFPADYWNTYVSFPLDPLTHDVIKEEGNMERSSMVFFVNPSFGHGPYTENSEEVEY